LLESRPKVANRSQTKKERVTACGNPFF